MFKKCRDYTKQRILNMKDKSWNIYYIVCAKGQKIEIR